MKKRIAKRVSDRLRWISASVAHVGKTWLIDWLLSGFRYDYMRLHELLAQLLLVVVTELRCGIL